ncbi:MAG: TipAS antibiotic-recognition domain-containing protein [Atopobiaceae bacterium]|nr:TipAS antibiotic-recognition domain-containing protein [Atopobiaceae bacterium]
MSDESFESLMRAAVEENEWRFGAEARRRYGDSAVDASNRRFMGMSEQECRYWQKLGEQIVEELTEAVRRGYHPSSETGARICELHREWLGFTWPSYTPEAHRGLAEMYVADDRFRSYYDRELPGCAQWLHDAIVAHT